MKRVGHLGFRCLLGLVGLSGASALTACSPGEVDPAYATEERRAESAGSATRFALPGANSFPNSITTGPDGALWFLETGKVGRITTAGVLTEFPASVSFLAGGITTGSDGALWFTDTNGGSVGRITTSGVVTRFVLPKNIPTFPRRIVDHPKGITAGPDGALWVTVQTISRSTLAASGAKIDRVTTAGAITEFSLPGGGTRRTTPALSAITAGSDGALWFTDAQLGRIGRITTSGVLTELNVPQGGPTGITKGGNGDLWFTTGGGASGQFGRVTTGGAFTEYSIPTGPNGSSISSFIARAADGTLWFSDYDMTNSNGSILRSTTNGTLSTFPFATFDEIDGMTAGPDGAIWFSLTNNQSGAASIGRITTH